jgi:glutamate/tyrosine decarboxylase-like PLP-dependent enzyme
MVPVTGDLKMDVAALTEQIARDVKGGFAPFMVVATAGTINAGVIDPLSELADVAEAHDLWYHVDAAWGGAAVMSERLRPVLAGIDRADSITCDAHKLFSVPVGAGMFFCRDQQAIDKTFGTSAAYVPRHAEDGRVYPYVSSMQWSRRFIGLKVFMMFAVRGLDEIARRIEHQSAMGDYLRRRLRAGAWSILNETPLPVISFIHPSLAGREGRMSEIVTDLKTRDVAWISKTVLGGTVPALRASITNFDTQPEDIDLLVDGLNESL